MSAADVVAAVFPGARRSEIVNGAGRWAFTVPTTGLTAVLPARDCPPTLQPVGARRAVKDATAAGWVTSCTYSVGTLLSDTGKSLRYARCVRVTARSACGRFFVWALWIGKLEGGTISFHSAWAYPGTTMGLPDKLSAAALREHPWQPAP